VSLLGRSSFESGSCCEKALSTTASSSHGIPEEVRFVERGHGSDYSAWASIDVDGGGNHKDFGNSGGVSFGQRRMPRLLDSYPRPESNTTGSYATTRHDLDSPCLTLFKIFPLVHVTSAISEIMAMRCTI
jgi:hypothetical protein